ncbi:MAG: hypothetical protein HYY49_07100, partial [Ignavibacteriales bacterium]|nr:hypothetical protein [Ignavibacteriales bacterium]
MRRFFRITFYFSVTTSFLVVALLGFTQTRYFRAYLRNVILQSYPEYMNGTVKFQKLEGNLVTGTRIHNVSIAQDSTEIFSAERIEVKYDLTGFLFDRVALSSVALINPRIHLWRSTDGSWNVSTLVKPAPDTTSARTVVEIKSAEIRNARIIFVDSLVLEARSQGKDSLPPAGAFDYASLELESVQLEVGVRIEPNNIFVGVRKFSFESRRPRFRLTRFNGDFTLSPALTSLANCFFQTRNSTVKVEAELKNIDVTKVDELKDLEKAPLRLVLDAEKVDARELKQLLYPTVDFLDRTFSLEAKAEGTLRTLSVNVLKVTTPRSTLQLRGTISNIHKPENIQLELASIDNKLSFADAEIFTPGLAIPNLRFLGDTRFNLVFTGTPDNFTLHLKGATDAGEIELDGTLRVEKVPSYKMTINARNVDLGIITQDDRLRSQLNARITLDGAGTDVRTMSAVARAEIDSSSVSDLAVNRSVIVLDINDRVIRSHTTTSVGTASYDISGTMQFHKDSTSFVLNGKVGSFDLGQVLKDPSYESDLTFELAAQGGWLDTERIQSRANLKFMRSSFNKQRFDSAVVTMQYDTRDTTTQSFSMTSDVADITVDGKFSLGSFLTNIVSGVEIVSKAIVYRSRNLDSLRAFIPFQLHDVPKFQAAAGTKRDSINAAFTVTLRDLYPLGVLAHQPLDGKLIASGTIEGDVNGMLTRGQIVSEAFGLSAQSLVLRTQNASLTWDLGGISRNSILETLKGTIVLQSEQWRINETVMSGVALTLDVMGSDGTYAFAALVDSTAHVNFTGRLDYRGGLYHFDIDELRIGVGTLLYENADPISVALGRDGFLVKSLFVRHEAEELSVSGYFHPAGVSDLEISAKGFLLNNYRQMVKPSKIPESLREIGGIVSGRLLVRGSVEHPNLSFDAVVDGVRVGETVFGQVESRFSYFEHALNMFVSYRYNPQEAAQSPDMLFSGTMPYELALGGAHTHRPTGQVDLALQSKGVRLDLFSPFIPVVSNLTGLLTCDLNIKGSTEAPEYSGYMSLSSAQFLFKPLNMHYILDGRFITDKKSIVFQEVTLKNIPQDQSYGRGLMNLSGNFTLEGLRVGEFNLLANGQLLLMKEVSRLPGAKFYGDLFASTGPSGVRWNGKPTKSFFSGEVNVKNGKLTLPPERETVFLDTRNIAILFHDDTSRSKPQKHSIMENNGRVGSLLALNASGVGVNGSLAVPADQKARDEREDKIGDEQQSFLDNIVYDLILEAQGP